MAFGSGNQSSKPPSAAHQHHHHHHHHPHQQQHHNHHSTTSSSSAISHQQQLQHPQQQSTSSTTTQQKCSVPTGSGGSVGGGVGQGQSQQPPNLPPKNYYPSVTAGASTAPSSETQSGGGYLHHHHSNSNNPLPLQQLFFQQSSTQSASSFNKSKQSYHHHHGGRDGGAFSSDGIVLDHDRYFSQGGGRGVGVPLHHHQHQHSHGHLGQINSTSSLSSTSQQQYNHHLFGQQQQHLPLNRDLTEPERLMLDQIRNRKAELLKEIAQLQDEIDCVSKELIIKDSTIPDHPPPPDLISPQNNPPLADIELDNLSEHSDEHQGNNTQHLQNQKSSSSYKIPSSSVLGSNNSSTSSSSLLSKEKERLKHMSLGCKKFNMDPKKGIEYLVLNGLLKKEDEMDVGMFLYRGEGLNKTAIGDYLGERNDFNERVLRVFVGLHDFTDLILVQALRQFLWSFRLPGEAQKIDRMMECFAQRYCQNNPDIFTNTDTCYVLSFAIIMLNTSLHNPSVKDKPTVEQFISMNRGINNGGDLPRELLISLYNSIQSEPFKIPEDDGNDLMTTFFNPDKEGWLWKQGGRYKTWKRRWFILNDNCLYYFEFTTDKEPRGIIPLENVGVREIEDGSREKSRQKYCFELFATDGSEVIKACKTDSDGKVVEGKHSVYRMSAAGSDERDSWVKALRQSISYSPLYEILRKSGGPRTAGGGNSSSSLKGGNRLRIE